MAKPTTDPFWVGDPYDYSNYQPNQKPIFAIGDAFGMGTGNEVTCSATSEVGSATPVQNLDPKTDPFYIGDPYSPLSAYTPSVPKFFGAGNVFGKGVTNSSVITNIVYFTDLLLDEFSENLIAYYPMVEDANDYSGNSIDPVTTDSLAFTGETPTGFEDATAADISSGYSKLDNGGDSPFRLSTFTISGWFKKSGAGTTVNTAGGADGFSSSDPIVPLITKGRGEADGNNRDCNWFLGLNKIDNGSTYRIAGDFEHIEASSPNNHRVVGTTLISDDQWYHGAITFDGTDFKVFLNGVEEGSVTPNANPRNDSIQMAAIGTSINSTGTVQGQFAGEMCGVAIWGEALTEANLTTLYEKGSAELRQIPLEALTVGAFDNHIISGDNFENWTVDENSSTSSAGIVIEQGSGDQAIYDVEGLENDTEYWMRITTDQKSAGAGNIRIVAIDDTGQEIAGTDGALVNVPDALGTNYLKVKTKAAQATSGQHRLVLKHASASAGETIRISEVILYPIPERSTAKMAVLGDRTGGYDSDAADLVDSAILSNDADTVYVLQTGDSADTTNPFTINDDLKSEVITRGGKIIPMAGNHDYDGDRENEWDDYYDTTGYNNGEQYYGIDLGNCHISVFDDNPENGDNGGGYSASAAANQSSTMMTYLKAQADASEKPWKIFMIHRPPYSSHSSGGAAGNRMDYAGLGYHLVIQAHYHGIERLHKDDVVYYTVARGGNNHHGWGTTNVYSQWKEDDTDVQGYLKIHDGTSDLILEYFDTDNNLLDRIKITQNDV